MALAALAVLAALVALAALAAYLAALAALAAKEVPWIRMKVESSICAMVWPTLDHDLTNPMVKCYPKSTYVYYTL